jgi:RNA polymerase sigma factor (sigma-70 family)
MENHKPAGVPDDQLIQYFLSNDPAALRTLVYLNKDKIYKSIYSVVQDKHLATEVLQDVFICIIDVLMSGKQVEEGKFLPWAMSIAHDMCINHLRKAKYTPVLKEKNDGHLEVARYTQPDTQAIMNHERHDEIRRMIDLLPDQEREVLMLRHYGGLSFKEIAEVMKCNINTALGNMRYALTDLNRIMEKKQTAF